MRPGVFLIAFVMFAACSVKESSRPNIVFIMTDDHGYQAVSAYNGELNSTPGLDRIADEGVIFTNSFVCNSICAPSRAALLTGKHSHANGHIDNRCRFDSSQVTFPKLLREAGYQTALIGKWHLKSEPTGFDYWNILPGQGQYYNPDFIEMGKKYRINGYATTIITDMAIDWIRSRDKSKPFCILVHHKAPHRNWMPDSLDFELFRGRQFPLPPTYFDDYSGRKAASRQEMSIARDMHLGFDLKVINPETDSLSENDKGYLWMLNNRLSPEQRKAWNRAYERETDEFIERKLTGDSLDIWKYNRYMTDYLRTIQSVDRNTGRLLDFIDSEGLRDNTLVVYTSDNGFYLGEHGWFDKRFMYEESFRIPLMMRLPEGYDAHGVIDLMVQNIDFAPTFLEVAGIKPPEEIQGISLVPLLKGKKVKKWRDALYYHYYEYPGEHQVRRHYGIRTGRYKLIHFYGDIDAWELFDLKTDTAEMNNLINDPEYSSIIQELKDRLSELRADYSVTEGNGP